MEHVIGGWIRHGPSQEDGTRQEGGVGMEQATGRWRRLELDTGGWSRYGLSQEYGASQEDVVGIEQVTGGWSRLLECGVGIYGASQEDGVRMEQARRME